MQTKEPAVASKPRFLDVRLRLLPDELDVIKAAAANRGLGFNTYLRLVSVGTSKRVLAEAPSEELVGRYIDPEFVRGRVSPKTTLDLD